MDIWSAALVGVQLVVACNSAVALWLSPRATLWLSDRLREQARERDEKRTARLRLFITLMQERSTPHTADAVRAFNAIDVTFADEAAVRSAWARLSECREPERVARLAALLEAMAASLGFGHLASVDFERVYAPAADAAHTSPSGSALAPDERRGGGGAGALRRGSPRPRTGSAAGWRWPGRAG